ncbi:MAG: PHB depolymerase family esterase [Anaerolineaceae bacterium]
MRSLGLVLPLLLGSFVLLTGCGSRENGNSTPAPTESVTVAATAAASAPSATLAPATNTVVAGASTGTLKVGSMDRSYRLFVPRGLGQGRVPLVVALHGGLGNPEQFARTSRFDELAAAEGFVVVYPVGFEATFNGGACCGRAASQKVDDTGFLATLILYLQSVLPIDPARTFATGHSNGAIMAFRFACERADLVAGVVPVAGSLEIPSCAPSRPVPLLAIHGDSDRNHPFEGGEGSRSIAGVAFRSMPDSLAVWTKAMGCAPGPAKQTEARSPRGRGAAAGARPPRE